MLLECRVFNCIHVLVDFWETRNICMLESYVLARRNNMLALVIHVVIFIVRTATF